MCTRGVWQLQKLIVSYCRANGDSAGARTFIKEELAPFAAANPWLSIEVVSKQGKAPTLIAEYLDGTGKHVDVKNKPAKHILEVARELRDGTTATVRKLMKPVVTARPSVQGVWGPDVSHAASAFALHESTKAGTPMA